MIYDVYMLAFGDGEIRKVNVPDSEVPSDEQDLLEKIFHYGQNDFQPVVGRCSVSCGDVVHIENRYWLCDSVGWKQISFADFLMYKQKNRI